MSALWPSLFIHCWLFPIRPSSSSIYYIIRSLASINLQKFVGSERRKSNMNYSLFWHPRKYTSVYEKGREKYFFRMYKLFFAPRFRIYQKFLVPRNKNDLIDVKRIFTRTLLVLIFENIFIFSNAVARSCVYFSVVA